VSNCERPGNWDWEDAFQEARVLRLCYERWALVKALMLYAALPQYSTGEAFDAAVLALAEQRDAVFSALAEMVRAEEVLGACIAALPDSLGRAAGLLLHIDSERPSRRVLAAYVSHLIEKTGVLP
jgi:hypothetical protein